MPSLDFEMLRKTLPIILCIGKSSDRKYAGKMTEALLDFVAVLREKQAESPDCNVEIVNYFFDEEVTSNSTLEAIENYDASILDNIYGKSSVFDFSKLLCKLNNDLSKNKLFNNMTGYTVPIIAFFIDADNQFIYDGLDCIKKNKWYQNSIKIAVVCDGYLKNCNTILELIGNNTEGFLTMSDTSMLNRLIITVSIAMGLIRPTNSLQGDDLIKVDPLTDTCDSFNAVLDTGIIRVDGETNIQLCQISACSPDKAFDTVFTLLPKTNSIEAKFYVDSVVETQIGAHGFIEICDCLERQINIVGNGNSLGFYINRDGKYVRIDNNSLSLCTLQVAVKSGEQFNLKDNDRVLDNNKKCIFRIVKIGDNLTGSIGDDILWDDVAWN